MTFEIRCNECGMGTPADAMPEGPPNLTQPMIGSGAALAIMAGHRCRGAQREIDLSETVIAFVQTPSRPGHPFHLSFASRGPSGVSASGPIADLRALAATILSDARIASIPEVAQW